MTTNPKSPLNHFTKRIKRLGQLYDYAVHSMSLVSAGLQEQVASGVLKPTSHVRSLHGFVVHHRVQNVVNNASHGFPFELRATVLVRLVTEFEIFLISEIREIVARVGMILKPDAHFDWRRSRLSSFDSLEELKQSLVESDCRNLGSQGFDEICKFYKKQFQIQVNPASLAFSDLREIHARRHLHVHRAGAVDERYAHEFPGAARPGSVLRIDDAYLRIAFERLVSTARHVSQQSLTLFPAPSKFSLAGGVSAIPSGQAIFVLTGKTRDDLTRTTYFDLERKIDAGPFVFPFKDILLSATFLQRSRVEWTIVGAKLQCEGYFEDLARAEGKGDLSGVTWRRLTPWKPA